MLCHIKVTQEEDCIALGMSNLENLRCSAVLEHLWVHFCFWKNTPSAKKHQESFVHTVASKITNPVSLKLVVCFSSSLFFLNWLILVETRICFLKVTSAKILELTLYFLCSKDNYEADCIFIKSLT